MATGFTDLDRLTGGLRPANLIVVAARPSMGKTALALCIAEHVALHDERHGSPFLARERGEELVQRMLGIRGDGRHDQVCAVGAWLRRTGRG